MRYRNSLIVVGLLIILVRLLGFPSGSKTALDIILGALVIVFAYMAGKEKKVDAAAAVTTEIKQ